MNLNPDFKMPDYHLRRSERVEDVTDVVVKKARITTDRMGDHQDMDLTNDTKDDNLDRIQPVKRDMLTSPKNNVSEAAVNDKIGNDKIKQAASEVPALGKPYNEIVLIAKIKIACCTLAIYLASFWIIKKSLTFAYNILGLVEIIAEIIDSPIAETFLSMRRILESVLDYQVGSVPGEDFAEEATATEVQEMEEAGLHVEDMEFLPTEELRKSSIVFKEIEPNLMKPFEKRKEEIDELEGSNNICNACNDILEECSEDIQDSYTQFEVITSVEELSINRLKTISSSSDEVALFCNVGSDGTSDDSEMEEELFEKVTTKTDDERDAIINTDYSKAIAKMSLEDSCVENVEGFLGSPATAPATTRRYPGFQHLYVSKPYQKRYDMTWRSVNTNLVKQDMVGPIKNLLDDLIGMVPQLSSSGATSCVIPDEPQD